MAGLVFIRMTGFRDLQYRLTASYTGTCVSAPPGPRAMSRPDDVSDAAADSAKLLISLLPDGHCAAKQANASAQPPFALPHLR